MIASGIPHAMDVGIKGLQKLQEQKQFAMLMGGGESAAAPAAPAVEQVMPPQTAAPAVEPTNALATKYPDANTKSVMFSNNNLASDVINANRGQPTNALAPAAVAAAPAMPAVDITALERRKMGLLQLGTPAAIAGAQMIDKQIAEATKPQIIAPGSSIYVPGKGFVATAPAKPEKEPAETQLAKLQRERQAIYDLNPKDPRIKTYDAAIKKESEFKPDTIITGPKINADATSVAADRYLTDGTLPSGISKPEKTAIMNRAAELAKERGVTGDRLTQLETKANQAALADITKTEARVGAFEKNFTKNVALVEKFSSQKDSSGVPILQKWINSGKKALTGDTQLASLAVAIKAVQNEYGKIVSGSMGNTAVAVSEIKRMEDLLNAAQTPQDVQAVLNTMRAETQNRMQGFKEQKAELSGAMTKATKGSSGATDPLGIR
jgi:hypothetical protein